MTAAIASFGRSEIWKTAPGPRRPPASAKSLATACAEPVTFAACFRTKVLPAIRAGAAARTACQTGKFQGMMARTVPSGWKSTRAPFGAFTGISGARKRAPWRA